MARAKMENWEKGIIGRVYSHHKSDGKYSAPARLSEDCPADSIMVKVELLSDFYCMSKGETFETERRYFVPEYA